VDRSLHCVYSPIRTSQDLKVINPFVSNLNFLQADPHILNNKSGSVLQNPVVSFINLPNCFLQLNILL
jgi:hypothetical protein